MNDKLRFNSTSWWMDLSSEAWPWSSSDAGLSAELQEVTQLVIDKIISKPGNYFMRENLATPSLCYQANPNYSSPWSKTVVPLFYTLVTCQCRFDTLKECYVEGWSDLS
jgi:hypothetical protein